MPPFNRFVDAFKKHAESKELRGHRDKVHSVGWNADGRRIASASVDQTARVWHHDRTSTRDCTELKGHSGIIDQLAWDPERTEILATASIDKTIRIWDIRTPRIPTTIIPIKGEIINLSWSPDGKTIAAGNKQDTVAFIDPRGGTDSDSSKTYIWHTIQNDNETNEIMWNYSMDLFFMTTGLGTIEILHYPSFEHAYTLEAHTANCYCIDMDPKGRYFATGGADALVAIWDIELLACVQTVGRLDHPVRSLAFSFDGELIATGSEDKMIDVTHVETGEQVCSIPTNGAMNSLAWHPSKHLLAYAVDEMDRYGRPEGNIHVYGISSRP